MIDPVLEDALRYLEAGEWDRAHRVVQDANGADAAWIHAHLHRLEGDLANAAYWYRRAGRPAATGDIEVERVAIAAALRSTEMDRSVG